MLIPTDSGLTSLDQLEKYGLVLPRNSPIFEPSDRLIPATVHQTHRLRHIASSARLATLLPVAARDLPFISV